jgi:hypothetical protein
MIPKIIHQTGPTNKDDWHPLWFKCQESWKKHFPDYEYKFWNDEEIDFFVKTSYPQYWEMYQEFPVHIMKIDFVRFCFMDKFGGIYADLDFFCYKNFSSEIKDKTYVVENPFGNDPIENSLMCSEPNSIFFKKCLEKTKQRYYEVKQRDSEKIDLIKSISLNEQYGKLLRPYLVFYISGTNLLSSVYRENKHLVSTLPGFVFNNLDYSYDKCYYTKHIHTGTWGKENLATFNKETAFASLRNIPIKHYDFYCDYSNGTYKTDYAMNFDKNDVEPYPYLQLKYAYS